MEMVDAAEYKTKVSSKGQIVIPKDIREKYGYVKGIELTLTPLDENKLLLEKVPKLSELFGFLGKTEASKALLRERDLEASVEGEREAELSGCSKQK